MVGVDASNKKEKGHVRAQRTQLIYSVITCHLMESDEAIYAVKESTLCTMSSFTELFLNDILCMSQERV